MRNDHTTSHAVAFGTNCVVLFSQFALHNPDDPLFLKEAVKVNGSSTTPHLRPIHGASWLGHHDRRATQSARQLVTSTMW